MGRKRKSLWGQALLEGFKYSYFQKLTSDEPLSFEERKEIAEFFCPEYCRKPMNKQQRGAPRGSRFEARNIRLFLSHIKKEPCELNMSQEAYYSAIRVGKKAIWKSLENQKSEKNLSRYFVDRTESDEVIGREISEINDLMGWLKETGYAPRKRGGGFRRKKA
jgi:hypothetical protein